MPLFAVSKSGLRAVSQRPFASEKALQRLIETNLDTVFKCRLVATEFSTGAQHAGRIDTLALSEDDNPVIIEYKSVESSDLVNQSLFYLAWIQDHRGDFQIAVQKSLGNVVVDWSAVRVICIAPNFRKYDLHAVRMMGAGLELWTYRLFANDVLYLEEVFQKSDAGTGVSIGAGKNPVMVAAGKKAAVARATGVYSVDQHLQGKPGPIRELAESISEFITGLDPSIEVVPKKLYIAFKTSQNIVCLEVKHKKLLLYLKLDPKQVAGPKGLSRDVTKIGHFGTGDLELTVSTNADFELAKPFIKRAYEEVGG